jgi:hypothetical protein
MVKVIDTEARNKKILKIFAIVNIFGIQFFLKNHKDNNLAKEDKSIVKNITHGHLTT